MKLRIKGNSLRLRLTQSEVNTFAQQGRLTDAICFGNSELTYSIESGNFESLTAAFSNDCVTVRVPQDISSRWTTTEQVGMESYQSLGKDNSLRILIEKDFACLTPRKDEDETDAYPNPNSQC